MLNYKIIEPVVTRFFVKPNYCFKYLQKYSNMSNADREGVTQTVLNSFTCYASVTEFIWWPKVKGSKGVGLRIFFNHELPTFWTIVHFIVFIDCVSKVEVLFLRSRHLGHEILTIIKSDDSSSLPDSSWECLIYVHFLSYCLELSPLVFSI